MGEFFLHQERMTDWQPQQEGLQQLVSMLSQVQVASQDVQRDIYQKIEEFHKVPDFNNYLIYIFTKLENSPTNEPIRMSAGLLLKNNITKYYRDLQAPVKNYIQKEVLPCLGDPADGVRATAGGIVSAIVRQAGLDRWEGLLENLVGALKNSSTEVRFIDGILSALTKICEDSAYEMCQPESQGGSQKYAAALNVIIPLLLQYLGHEVAQFRRYALISLNQFITLMPRAFTAHFVDFLQAVFRLANDPSSRTKKEVCTSFMFLASVRVEYILPHFNQIVPMMLQFTKDEDTEVALEACEFWNVVCDHGFAKEALRPHLPQLVPVLLESMVYSETDQLLLSSQEEDSSVPDQAQDIEPTHFKSSRQQSDDDEDDEDDYSEWNLRKCAAASLDFLAMLYRDELLSILIPILQARMVNESNWAITECNILALGAIAKGCYAGMTKHLSAIVPYLLKQLEHPHTLVKAIACWSVSRYSHWITEQEAPLYLVPLLKTLLSHMLSRNKKVQQAACTAMTHLQESTRVILLEYSEPIITAFQKAFSLYQTKNLLILFDAIGIFAISSIRRSDNTALKQKFAEIIMPPLVELWNHFPDDNKGLCSLAECFIDIFSSAGSVLKPFAVPVYTRSLRIIDTNLRFFAENRGERLDSDFIVASLNLLSVMTEAFGPGMKELVSQSNLLEILYRCLKENSRIRQEAFALLGDLTPFCMGQMKDVLDAYIPEILNSIAPNPGKASGNAAWAMGMIIQHSDDQAITPFASRIMEALKWVMCSLAGVSLFLKLWRAMTRSIPSLVCVNALLSTLPPSSTRISFISFLLYVVGTNLPKNWQNNSTWFCTNSPNPHLPKNGNNSSETWILWLEKK